MRGIEQATLAELATELERSDIALAIGLSRKAENRWRRYRRAVQAEIDRRCPVPANLKDISDDELLRQLSS